MTQPDDIEYLTPWYPALRHARSVCKLSGCMGVVTMRVVVDEMGRPCGLWMLPRFEKLLPQATADMALREIVEKLTMS